MSKGAKISCVERDIINGEFNDVIKNINKKIDINESFNHTLDMSGEIGFGPKYKKQLNDDPIAIEEFEERCRARFFGRLGDHEYTYWEIYPKLRGQSEDEFNVNLNEFSRYRKQEKKDKVKNEYSNLFKSRV